MKLASTLLAIGVLSGLAAGCDDDDTTAAAGTTPSTTGAGATGGTPTGSGGTGGTGGGGGGSGPVTFSIPFEGRVGDTAFSCLETFAGVGVAATEVRLTDFRLYVHDFRLIDASNAEVPLELSQDGLWQHEDLALLDFEDGTGSCANGTSDTRAIVEGIAPAGEYTGIAFKLGVPPSLNHLDNATAPSPLNLSALFWSWSSGFKYLRVDSVPATGGEPFNLHLGATECVGDPILGEDVICNRTNVVEVRLSGWDPATSTIVVDYGAVVGGSDVSLDAGGAPGCMSGTADPECSPIFERLGIDIVSGEPNDAQELFRIE